MKLSIIIPTFNSASVLPKALDSIVGQTFTDWEVLVMDGVSTDNTIEIAQSYKDPRIHIYSEPDKGIYDAMNKGIKKAEGEWLYFLGSDDSLRDNSVFEKVMYEIDNASEKGLMVFYGDVYAPQLEAAHHGEWKVDKLFYNRCHQAIFYHREVFEKLGLYDLKYRILADYAFNLKWFVQGVVKNRYIPVCIANYSADGLSSREQDVEFDRDFGLLVLKYGWRRLPIYVQKEAARDVIRNNRDKIVLVAVMRVYVILLRIVAKITVRL